MSAKPRRPLHSARASVSVPDSYQVRFRDSADVEFSTDEHVPGTWQVNLNDLPRAELCALVKRLGGTPKVGDTWLTNDVILTDIKNRLDSAHGWWDVTSAVDFLENQGKPWGKGPKGKGTTPATAPDTVADDQETETTPVVAPVAAPAAPVSGEWFPLDRGRALEDKVTAKTATLRVLRDDVNRHETAHQQASSALLKARQAWEATTADMLKLRETVNAHAAWARETDDVIVKIRQDMSAMLDMINDLPTGGSVTPPAIHVNLPGKPDAKVIEGLTHEQFPLILQLLGAGVNVYLTGTPGVGKSHVVEQCADALGLAFSAISCHAQMTAVSLFGYMNATGDYVRTEFRDRFEHGGIFLCDEMDNGNAGIIAAMNQALANKVCAFPDGMVKRHDDFRVVAATNTWGTGATASFSGRVRLDAATLNRFVKLEMVIDERLEMALSLAQCNDHAAVKAHVARCRKARKNALKYGLNQVFVTPRDCIDGAKLIHAGVSADQAFAMRVTAGLDEDTVRKLTAD